uniref:DnaJ homologue subfamily C member 28 conserved domain-containing protein n=1 Tax=Kalanchoe fedtschenkoi TaxID=63787 RepID=A0A7N0SVD0_KALFE
MEDSGGRSNAQFPNREAPRHIYGGPSRESVRSVSSSEDDVVSKSRRTRSDQKRLIFSIPWFSDCSSETCPKKENNMKDRLSGVIDAVNDRKLPPELRGQRNNIRSESDITNVVERRIWQSMLEGDFENLPGKGKPLDLSSNPHVDPAEDTLYRILSRNKCAPEWIELNKEIRSRVDEWRVSLKKAWVHKCEGNHSEWDERTEGLKLQMRGINDMVFRYNLIVPFGRQMFGLKWEKEVKLVEGT